VKKKILLIPLALLLAISLIAIGCAAPAPTPGAPTPGAPPAEVIHWRLQTYAGPALAEHVCKVGIDMFNKAAAGRMVIDMYTADELVPHGELFRALQEGTVDAVQSDDDSIASPVDVAIFAAYFPMNVRYGIDVNVLWEHYGLNEIWEEAYAEVPNVTWLGSSSWDPCNFGTVKPIRHVEDLKGLRCYMFPTGGQFMQQFGVVPMVLPYEDVEMAIETGVLDGVSWCGSTEMHTVGWADVINYYLTNNISGGWMGSWFVNTESWEKVPPDLQEMFKLAIDASDYYRLHWYWWGEAHYRTSGKLELTTIPAEEWKVVEDAALVFWDKIALKSPRCAKVVQILKDYTEIMDKVGSPYR